MSSWYKLRCPTEQELKKKTAMEILQTIIEIYNVAGFVLKPSKYRPEIKEFMEKHPDLIEKDDQLHPMA